jgi:hypothetical protein
MKYSKGLILYQDTPEYGLFLKLIVIIVPVLLLFGSYYLFSRGERDGGLTLLVEAFIIGLIFFSVFPHSYRVYEDHLQIVLGGPFSIKIGFDKIKSVEVTSRIVFSVNFATRMTGRYVAITPKTGLTIAITPKDNGAFVENANRALAEWAKTNTALGR